MSHWKHTSSPAVVCSVSVSEMYSRGSFTYCSREGRGRGTGGGKGEFVGNLMSHRSSGYSGAKTRP